MEKRFSDAVLSMLPDDVTKLCDHSAGPWPSDWADNFGMWNFFYVAGLREYLQARPNPVIAPLRAKKAFKNFISAAGSLVRNEWISQLYWDRDPQDIDIEECKKLLKLHSLSEKRFGEALLGKPVTFSSAVLSLVTLAAIMHADGDDRPLSEVAEVRFAGHFLPYYGELHPNLSISQRIHLSESTQQFYEELFEDIADGYPITFALATKISKVIGEMTDERGVSYPVFKVATYPSRGHIFNGKGIGSHNRNTKRVAEPENVFLRWPQHG